jgi:hypothetical protein
MRQFRPQTEIEQGQAEGGVCGVERPKPIALCLIVHRPEAPGGSIGLPSVMNDDKGDGGYAQGVDKEKPRLA